METLRENGSFGALSLWLSRACLGKMIVCSSIKRGRKQICNCMRFLLYLVWQRSWPIVSPVARQSVLTSRWPRSVLMYGRVPTARSTRE